MTDTVLLCTLFGGYLVLSFGLAFHIAKVIK